MSALFLSRIRDPHYRPSWFSARFCFAWWNVLPLSLSLHLGASRNDRGFAQIVDLKRGETVVAPTFFRIDPPLRELSLHCSWRVPRNTRQVEWAKGENNGPPWKYLKRSFIRGQASLVASLGINKEYFR